jgi:hypothetical protein
MLTRVARRFGHQLRARAARDEHVFAFCFSFLQYIEDEQFSLPRLLNPGSVGSSGAEADDVGRAAQREATSGAAQSSSQTQRSASGAPLSSSSSPPPPSAVVASSAPLTIAANGSPIGAAAAGSWQLVDETTLSASSFDATIDTPPQLPSSAPSSRRARRLALLRQRFDELYAVHVAPTMAAVAAESAASHVNGVAAASGHAVASYTRSLFSTAGRAVSAVAASMQ